MLDDLEKGVFSELFALLTGKYDVSQVVLMSVRQLALTDRSQSGQLSLLYP